MKTTNPIKLALFLSAVFSVMSGLLNVIFLAAAGQRLHWVIVLIPVMILFLVQYLLLRYYLLAFIYQKIKLIYKTIHNLKFTREEKRQVYSFPKGRIFEQATEDVANWATAHRQEVDELKQQEKHRREFLANVSHELKTPLSNIQGFTLTLLDNGLNDPDIQEDFLIRIQRNTDRMISIVNQLEEISRLESGEARPVKARFDLQVLVREVMDFLEPKAKEKDITLMLADPHYHPKMVNADCEQIRQVLINLMDNSVKYGKPGGRTKVSFYDMDENLLVEVSDNGMGIEEEHLPHLFERFYRVDKHRARSGGGSGLGLAIVKHIIEAHGQTVNVRSAPGVGPTFSFTLESARP